MSDHPPTGAARQVARPERAVAAARDQLVRRAAPAAHSQTDHGRPQRHRPLPAVGRERGRRVSLVHFLRSSHMFIF